MGFCRVGGGSADVRELVWGTPEGRRVAAALSLLALDLVVAADCVYEVPACYASPPARRDALPHFCMAIEPCWSDVCTAER